MSNTTKYVVKVDSVFSTLINVEATSEEEARKAADQIMANDEERNKLNAFYAGTFPMENWAVLTEEEYLQLKADITKELSQNVPKNGEVGQNGTPANTDGEGNPTNIIVPDRF